MISVVLPVLNGEDYIAGAISSAQEAGVGEVVVIDDGSEDRTVEIARGFEIVRLFENPGPTLADSYNKGFEEARGDRFTVIGHDDTIEPGAMDALGAALDAGAAIAFGQVNYVLAEAGRPPASVRPGLLDEPQDAILLEAMLVTREAFERVGPMRHGVWCDVDWFARLGETDLPVARVPEVVTRKRLRADSAMHVAAEENPAGMLRVLRDAIERRRSAAS